MLLLIQASDFSSPVRVPGNGAAGGDASDEAQAEGFICPICMKGFVDPIELQQHFENEHSDSPPSNGTGGKNKNMWLNFKNNLLEMTFFI